MSSFQASVTALFHFEAAHHMPNFPEGHPNRRVHGHSYGVEVTVKGLVKPESGCVIDHGDLVQIVRPSIDMLDHGYLNDIPSLELPTSECIARWMWKRLKPSLPELSQITLRRDSCGISVSYFGEGADL